MDERSAEEFREYMHGRWPSMVRLAYGLTGDQGHAEDVAAAAFARAYASWPRVTRSGNPDAYVRQIVDTTGHHDERLALIAALQRRGLGQPRRCLAGRPQTRSRGRRGPRDRAARSSCQGRNGVLQPAGPR